MNVVLPECCLLAILGAASADVNAYLVKK